MSVEEIKRELAALSASEEKQVADCFSQLGQEEAAKGDLDAFVSGRLAQAQAGDFSDRSVSEIWREVQAAF